MFFSSSLQWRQKVSIQLLAGWVLPNSCDTDAFQTRDDTKFDYLHSDSDLSKQVGEFIELPLAWTKPKQFEPEHWKKFLLTPQRWEVASEVIDAIGTGPLEIRTRNGLCLSGPQGVGKCTLLESSCTHLFSAALNYLIASLAYVRGWHLQYIVSNSFTLN
jgi:hypothetical protein